MLVVLVVRMLPVATERLAETWLLVQLVIGARKKVAGGAPEYLGPHGPGARWRRPPRRPAQAEEERSYRTPGARKGARRTNDLANGSTGLP